MSAAKNQMGTGVEDESNTTSSEDCADKMGGNIRCLLLVADALHAIEKKTSVGSMRRDSPTGLLLDSSFVAENDAPSCELHYLC
mmetsp:Transcript_10926/g.18016  ORF Transcript_10926/g.18016 Transcript_10926/m.18016 type:complete len:84 (+) Transcript_10926:187-438(+)